MESEVYERYGDMLPLKAHVSPTHPRMSVSERAAQFSPFAALTGYEDALAEAIRYTQEKPEPSEDEKEAISQKIALLMKAERPQVQLRYYQKDERKKGGKLLTCTGRVKRIQPEYQTLLLENGLLLNFSDILNISENPDSSP